MSAVISARNLSKSYGKKPAVDNVTFDIPAGRIVGLSKLPRVAAFEDKPYIFIYISLLFATMALRLLMAARRMSR